MTLACNSVCSSAWSASALTVGWRTPGSLSRRAASRAGAESYSRAPTRPEPVTTQSSSRLALAGRRLELVSVVKIEMSEFIGQLVAEEDLSRGLIPVRIRLPAGSHLQLERGTPDKS